MSDLSNQENQIFNEIIDEGQSNMGSVWLMKQWLFTYLFKRCLRCLPQMVQKEEVECIIRQA